MDSKQIELETKAQDVLTAARRIEIDNDKNYETAGEFLVGVKRMAKQIKDFFEPMRAQTYSAYQEVTKTTKRYLGPVDKAEKEIKAKMTDYTREQDRKRREEEDRARKEEEDRLLDEAIETEDETVLDKPLFSEPMPRPAPPKAKGVSTRVVYTFRVTNPEIVPRRFLIIDMPAIRRHVNEHKAETSIPGVEIYAEEIVVART